ncbi:MAG TPA: PilZ domain-containing protein, partial [Vicinamibacteria bacterium]|nr:PilZ domain-containing protein [Vicinamibacteria bacterium]
MSQSERRRVSRMKLSMPVRVQGHDSEGVAWEEMASVQDASAAGVALNLRHAITRGQVLMLTLPLPKAFRRYDLTDASYRVFGLVRAVNPATGTARVGVMFLGRHPPRGYERNHGGLFLLPQDAPPERPERRRGGRLEVFVNLRLRHLQPHGASPSEEQTIAENIGHGGARVLSSLEVAPGDVLEVQEVGGTFRTRAEVRNMYVG